MKKIKPFRKPHYMQIFKTWDGIAGKYKMSDEEIKYWRMMKDTKDGDIYYFDWGTPRKLSFWGGASILESHLRKLYNQERRYNTSGNYDIKKLA